ncbi:MAG: tRNA (adenosine(37)-N6)-threonylcarbamoyltransferase complex dimerization subunit type 1 TsaB [Chitinophagaceae bacterium]
MAIILNIDTSTDSASVCLANEAASVKLVVNDNQKDHASWLHTVIQKLISKPKLSFKDIDALAVTMGPGSYTGLRVGLSAAKGLCFASGLPLIGINTLEMMAHPMLAEEMDLICPVIDARRMEVFMAVYNKKMEEIVKPCAMIIEKNSFDHLFGYGRIIFSGTGVQKLEKIIAHSNAVFSNTVANASDMTEISERKFAEKDFIDLAYAEPFYIKEFYSTASSLTGK